MIELNKLVSKEVKVYCKNNFFYQGVLNSFDQKGIIIEDRIHGITYINLSNIDTIVEVKNGRK